MALSFPVLGTPSMTIVDWLLAILPILFVLGVGWHTRRYMRGVADFMSGGRSAGRYLIAVGRGEFHAGAVGFVAMFEVISRAGFTMFWWQWLSVPVTLIVAITGFVLYRFRETRALTLAQFFEIRYSRNFRLFTGLLAFFSGILNFGIIPAVGSRVMVCLLGLPPALTLFGHSVPTYVPLMGVLLSFSVFLTLFGGFISVMVTDCVEGIFSQLFYLVIIAALLLIFSWSQVSDVLSARPLGQSMLNPFDSSGIKDFNLWFVLMGLFVTIYGTMAYQSSGGYNSAARSGHESRMAGLLGRWREQGKYAVVTLLAVCSLTFLHHADFAVASAPVHEALGQIPDTQIQKQMEIPMALAHLLPIGIKGVLCAVLLMGILGGDATHLHSWGGILVQDVIVPLRKKPLEPRQHIFLLRLAVVGVAIFAFAFGSLYRQIEFILMWWNVTIAVYVGGAGAAIIGGLYWKKGTTAGAWAGLLTGSFLSGGGVIARQVFGEQFPLNGMQVSFFATLIAISLYVTVSLLTWKKDFDLNRMLHRENGISPARPQRSGLPFWKRIPLGKWIGLDAEFTRGDRWIAGSLFAWSLFWFGVLVVGCIWNWVAPWPTSVWSTYWHITGVGLPIFLAAVTGLWFTWGGLKDIAALFRDLRHGKVNVLDDGTVTEGRNLDELEPPVCSPAEKSEASPNHV